ncbi:hypothetical protein MBANPS3_005606 [Mucor bainieri]
MSQTETATTTTVSSEEAKNVSPSGTTTTNAQVAPQQQQQSSQQQQAKKDLLLQKEKGKKQVDPEYVKSPLPAESNNNNSNHGNRPSSTATSRNAGNNGSGTGSVKPFQKGGFLSLLLCCTVGAGSFLDNSDKSSSLSQQKKHANRNSRASSQQTKEKTSSSPVESSNNKVIPVPPIITNPTELDNLSNHPTLPADPTAAAAVKTSTPTPTTPTNYNNINNTNTTDPDLDESSTSPISLPPQTSPVGPVVWLLPPLASEDKERKCLVLDLDETLVHSSFKIIPNPDFIVPVEIDNQYHNVYVLKRPGVDEFMRKMGEKYEIVVFTASLAKDLSQLGRNLASTLILDNSPASYIFHTSNAVPVSTWFNDPHDTELTDLVAFLEDLTVVDDVQLVLDNSIDPNLVVTSTA